MTFDGWKKLYILAGKTFSYQDWQHIRFLGTDPDYTWMEQSGYIVWKGWEDHVYMFTDKFIGSLDEKCN